jgi:hypothetical protein
MRDKLRTSSILRIDPHGKFYPAKFADPAIFAGLRSAIEPPIETHSPPGRRQRLPGHARHGLPPRTASAIAAETENEIFQRLIIRQPHGTWLALTRP